jgi:hypothetical protein
MLYRRGPWIAPALETFQNAVALDPDYVQGWAGVADAYTTLCYSGYRRPTETCQRRSTPRRVPLWALTLLYAALMRSPVPARLPARVA